MDDHRLVDRHRWRELLTSSSSSSVVVVVKL
jgi:hypothetical protein